MTFNLTQTVRYILEVEDRALLVALDAVILKHAGWWLVRIPKPLQQSPIVDIPIIHAGIISFDLKTGFGCNGLDHEVVIAMWAIFVTRKGQALVSRRLSHAHAHAGGAYLSSNSAASLRKHFLHFLHAKIWSSHIRTRAIH